MDRKALLAIAALVKAWENGDPNETRAVNAMSAIISVLKLAHIQ
jgi:hypothetical protein